MFLLLYGIFPRSDHTLSSIRVFRKDAKKIGVTYFLHRCSAGEDWQKYCSVSWKLLDGTIGVLLSAKKLF